MPFWGTELLENFRKKSSHIGKVTVWVAISSQSLIGSVFLNEMMNCKRHFLAATYGQWLVSAEAAVYARWCHAA